MGRADVQAVSGGTTHESHNSGLDYIPSLKDGLKQTVSTCATGGIVWRRSLQTTLTFSLARSPIRGLDTYLIPMKEKHIISPSLYKSAWQMVGRRHHLDTSRGCYGSHMCNQEFYYMEKSMFTTDFESGWENWWILGTHVVLWGAPIIEPIIGSGSQTNNLEHPEANSSGNDSALYVDAAGS